MIRVQTEAPLGSGAPGRDGSTPQGVEPSSGDSGVRSSGSPSDEALCRRVGQGDDGAFDLLVERYRGRAYRLAWSIVRDPDEAWDLSQEAFIRLYERAGSFNGQARFSTWFYKVLTNLCLDHRRRRRWWGRLFAADEQGARAAEALDNYPAPTRDPADEIDRQEARTRLWQEVDRLPDRQRAAVVLHVHEELPTGEIAAVLGCAESTVRVHLHRALETLRRRMEQNGGGATCGPGTRTPT